MDNPLALAVFEPSATSDTPAEFPMSTVLLEAVAFDVVNRRRSGSS